MARRQLLALGFGRGAIARRVRAGRLHPEFPGVYAVGYRVRTRLGRSMAAVLAGGPGAVAAGGLAAWAWGLSRSFPSQPALIVPRAFRSVEGLHRRRIVLPADEMTVHEKLPITTTARTLLDRAGQLEAEPLRRELEQAEVLRLTDVVPLVVLMDRHPRTPGIGKLRAILAEGLAGANATRSALEDRFLALVAGAGLPRPSVNALVQVRGGPLEVDCVWRTQRFAVELDGYAFHATRSAIERDHDRQARLTVAGWRVVRVTWRRLDADEAGVIRDLRDVLGAGPPARHRAR